MTPAAAWAAVVAAATEGAAYHRQGIGRADPAHQDEVRAVVESTLAAEPPSDTTVEREGARLALFGPAVYYKLPNLHDRLVRFWVAARGVDFALEAALASLRWERRTPDDYVNYGAWLAPRSKPELEWEQRPTWRALHVAYAQAAPAERERARSVARRAGEGAPLALRAALAYVVFDDDALWTEADRRAATATTDFWSELSYRVVLAEVRRAKLVFDDQPTPAAIASALGAEAFVALQLLYRSYPNPERGEPLAALATPEALAVLVRGGEGGARKEIGPVIASAVRASPRVAIEGLSASPPRGPNALAPLARAILLSLVAEHPSEVQSPALLAEAGVDRPVAEPSELPAPLAAPPWRASPAKKAAPKKAAAKTSSGKQEAPAVAELAYEEALDWGTDPPEERDNWHGTSEEELIARIERDRDGDRGTVFLHSFTWGGVLSPANALRLLASIPATQLYGQVDDIERILLGYGLPVLEPVLAYVKRQPDRLPALRGVDSPRVAPIAAHAFATSKKNKEAAQQWLERHPAAAATHLLPLLVSAVGKAREPVELALRQLLATQGDAVRAVAARYAHPAVDTALAALGGGPVGPAVPKKLPKLPPWAVAARLPRPILRGSGKALSVDAATDLLHWLSFSKLEAPHPALAEIARAMEPRSLARFAFGLFTEWLLALGPPKEAWAMNALAPFGDAEVARALVPLSRDWAPRGLPQRAQAVVNVLAAMGNDAALLGIHRLSKVRSRALAAHADKTLARVATERGLGKDELADRLVPDLGLDADGTKTFVVAGRAFAVRFDEELAPKLVDEEGVVHSDLPKPKKGDDEEAAATALEEWRELKKSAKRVAKEQAARLEIAMSAQRRFPLEHFETFFARHPLLFHVARRLVWGVYEDGALKRAFRVGEDGGWLGEDDREVALEPGARIGVVHPLELDAKSRATWGDRLADDELVQPFQQLARDLHAVEPGERAALGLDRYVGKKLATTKVLGLERSGWKREASGQGGMVAIFEKTFGDVRARLGVQPGVYLGDPSMHPEQTIEAVLIGRKEALPLGEVPKVPFSEVVRDLEGALAER